MKAPDFAPPDGEWRSLPPKLMYRILSFPDEIASADRTLNEVMDWVANPPDYPEYFETRTRLYGGLGLKGLALADDLRRTYGIPVREYEFHEPRQLLTKATLAKTSD